MNGHRRNITLATLAIILGLISFACGPKLRVSSLSSETLAIKNWSIVPADSLPDSLTSRNDRARVKLDQGTSLFHSVFVEQVRGELSSNHGIRHYENMPTGGYISIRCILASEYAVPQQDTLAREDESSGASAAQFTNAFTYMVLDKILNGSPVKIVEVTIYRDDGFILGMFRLGNGKDERVKASAVAKNIAKTLAEKKH